MIGVPRGVTSLIAVFLLISLFPLCRRAFHYEGPPAFFVTSSRGVTVALGEGFSELGIRQFDDGATPFSVIKLATRFELAENTNVRGMLEPLRPGELLALDVENGMITGLRRSWLPAAQRLAIPVPLHPDRMGLEDWQVLPGIGPALALRIELDRQKNGDFGSLEGLLRVSGIGKKRIESWRKFF